MFDRGSLTLARWRGSSFQIHWSFPLGIALFTAWQGLAPGAWLGFTLIAVVHLLGHQLLAAMCGMHVEASVLHALGGGVRPHAGTPTTPARRSIVAWGAILAQAILLGAVALAVGVRGWPASKLFLDLVRALAWGNVALLVLHLLPLPFTDGWEAWRLIGRVRRERAVVVIAPPGKPLFRSPRPAPRPIVARSPRTTPTQPFVAQRAGTSASASVVYDSDVRLSRETEDYLRAVIEKSQKSSRPKN